jgi:hypothetical protein
MVKRKTGFSVAKTKRPSASMIAAQADQILAEASRREGENARKGMKTVTISRAALIAKLRGRTAHSPFLTQVGWGAAVRGSIFVLNFGLMNPDPWPYENANLALCYCWANGAALADPGLALLAADPSVGVRQVELGILNTAATPYYLAADHAIPTTFQVGPADLNYFLYRPDPWLPGLLLTRGTIRVDVT